MGKTKVCTMCKKEKLFSSFNKNKATKDGYQYYCKECRSSYAKDYIVTTNGRKTLRARRLKHLYDLTLEDYDILYNKQKGRCAVCGIHQSELGRLFDIDHNHITKEIRGLLCNKCNQAIGLFNVDKYFIKLLDSAIKYIKETR